MRRFATKLHAHGEFGAVSIAGVFGLLINTATALLIARSLGPRLYGNFVFLSSIQLSAMLLFGFGVTTQSRTDITRSGTGVEQKEIFTRLFWWRVVTLAPLLVVGSVAIGIDDLRPIAIVLWVAGLALMFDFFIGVLQGLALIWQVVIYLSLQPLLFLGAVVLLDSDQPEMLMIYLAASFLIVNIYAMARLRHLLTHQIPSFAGLHKTIGTLHLAWNAYLDRLCQTGYFTYALLILGLIAHYESVAYLNVSLTPARLSVAAVGPLLTSVFFPAIVRTMDKQVRDQATDELERWVAPMALLGISAALVLLFWPQSIVLLLFGPGFSESATWVQALAPLTVLWLLDTVLTLALIGIDCVHLAWRISAARLFSFIILVFTFAILTTRLPDVALMGTGFLITSILGIALQYLALRRAIGWRPDLYRGVVPLPVGIIVGSVLRLMVDDGGTIASTQIAVRIGVNGVLIMSSMMMIYFWAQRQRQGTKEAPA